MLTELGQLEEGDRFTIPSLPELGVCVYEGRSLVTSLNNYYKSESGEFRLGTNKMVVDKLG